MASLTPSPMLGLNAPPTTADEPIVSVITPVYNGSGFIAENLRTMLAEFERLDVLFEIIVVCDGSTDATAERARSVVDERIRVVRYPVNRGKGFAIVHGVGHARGRLVGWLDSDLDIHPHVIVDAVDVFATQAVDVVVGSKRHPGSFVDYPWTRRVFSWGFQLVVRLLFRVNVRDTQVGAKLFRREVLDVVAPLLLVKRYAFDLEVLAAGADFGFDRIQEAPVRLSYRFTGTGVNWNAIYRMIGDTLAIAYRIHIRHHYVRRFAAHHRTRLDTELSAASLSEAR
jgi:dolichol-phosphate mannosyltransferase